MKKFLSLSLVVVLVLVMGAVAFAASYQEGKLGSISAEIPVTATIGPYASVKLLQQVDFGILVGKVGLYTANGLDNTPGKEFYNRAATMFGDDTLAADFDPSNDNSIGHGAFELESNTDVNVEISFNAEEWLTSPTLFAVARKGDPTSARAWASANFTLPSDTDTSFSHLYSEQENEPVYYGIDGAINIEYISQQLAKAYTGVITITVSQ